MYLAAVVPLPITIRLETDADEQILDDLVRGRSPSVGVALGTQSFKAQSPDKTKWRGDLELVIYACVKNQRSALAGVVGDHASPGSDAILEHCLERLAGIEVVPGVSLVPTSEEPAWIGAGWMIWEQRYQVVTQYDLRPNRDVVGVAKEVMIDHELAGATTPAQAITELELPS